MTRVGKRLVVSAVVVLLFSAAGTSVRADITFVSSRSALGGTDQVDWGALGPVFNFAPNPFTVMSSGGVSVTGSKPTVPDPLLNMFQRRDEQPTEWFGNFAIGDKLLWTQTSGGPLTLKFDVGVNAAGTQIQPDFFANSPFTAQIDALDAAGNVLASFTASGLSNHNEDNSALFLGVHSDQFDIFGVRFSLVPAAGPQDFAINGLSFNATPSGTGVPEPGSLALLGLGVLGLAGWRARRQRLARSASEGRRLPR
jgi:hypothetical protein